MTHAPAVLDESSNAATDADEVRPRIANQPAELTIQFLAAWE